ncbi:MAG: 4-hydroxythreonine-4-phosphate dehydrogenase PdxA [Pseudomonadota bacterium]
MSQQVAPLAVSMGEPAGIGTEILLKAYAALTEEASGFPVPFFTIDDPARLAKITRDARAPFRVLTIEHPKDAAEAFKDGLPVLPLGDEAIAGLESVTLSQPSPSSAKAVISSIESAVSASLNGSASGVVTLPIQKSVLSEAGFAFPGHTEFLGALTESTAMLDGRARGPVMMLAGPTLRTVPVTVHVPLKQVPEALTTEAIVHTATVTAQSLIADFGVAEPKIAISGLNPHAGENGMLGAEDRDIILPAIKILREQGIRAAGPFPADTMFHEEARSQYHAALAMYHDQALVPVKTLHFHDAVNVTLGLPIIRTSPDHGTGLPIAGKGVARPDSTIAAIRLAANMAVARARHGA